MTGKNKTASNRDTLAKVRAHIVDVEARLKKADANTRRSVQSLDKAFNALSLTVERADLAALDSHFKDLTHHLERQLTQAKAEVKRDLAAALADPHIDHVRKSLGAATSRLANAERRQAENIQQVNEQIIRLATAIDKRMRNESRAREALETRFVNRFSSLETVSDTRINELESQSVAAITKIGSQVAELSQQLEVGSRASQKHTEGLVSELKIQNEAQLNDLGQSLERRINGVQKDIPALSPLEHEIASLSLRLEKIEAAAIDHLARPSFAIAPAGSVETSLEQGFEDELAVDPHERQADQGATILPYAPKATEPTAPAVLDAYSAAPSENQQSGPQVYNANNYPPLPDFDDMPIEAHTDGNVGAVEQQRQLAVKLKENYQGEPLLASSPLNQTSELPAFSDAHLSLHDYDAPLGLGAAEAVDLPPYSAPALSADSLPPYEQNPYLSQDDSTAESAQPQMEYELIQPMAEARPGAEPLARTNKKKRSRKTRTQARAKSGPESHQVKIRPFSKSALRTAGLAFAVCGAATYAAFVIKGNMAEKQNALAYNPDSVQRSISSTNANDFVSSAPPKDQVILTPATGAMTLPKGIDARPSNPQIGSAASLDAAVTAGNPIAQLQKGLTLLQDGKDAEAAKLVRLAANQELPAAQYYLGNFYENGQGLPRDQVQARKLTEQAARSGHRIAMYDLALYYIEGKGGVKTDLASAAQWFRKAAEYGMTDAQYNLAVLHERGTGVKQDLAEAYYWYAIAGNQGDQDAGLRARELASSFDEKVMSRAKRRVENFVPADFNEEANGIFRNLPWDKATKKVAKADPTVSRVQSLLVDLGYDAGVADGAIGPKTREAIRAFERDNGLPQSGQADQLLLETLETISGA